MFLRTLMLLLSAAVLFVVSPAVRACPTHEAQLHTVETTVAATSTLSAIAPDDCTADDPSSPCGQFHLCCVTPPGLPTADAAFFFTPFPQTAAVSRSPADTGVIRDLTSPPPKS